jgi:arylsulfatase A-like enzyme
MRRLLLSVLVLGALLCRPAAAVDRTERDLTRLASQRPGNGSGSSRRFEVPPRGRVDVFVRLPAESELRVDALDGADDAALLVVAGEQARETIRPTRGAGGGWEVSLGRFDGQPVRLRFKNRSRERSLAWRNPRIAGVDRQDAPVLPRAATPGGVRPNVILYVVDTLRADRLSVYGYQRPTTPELIKLADRGVLFTNAYSAGAHTSPSITALFASRLPSELSGRLMPSGPARRTLAELFEEAGYDTAGFQANYGLIAALGFARGFDEYHVLKEATPTGLRYLHAEEVHEQVLPWVRAHRDRPFFLYVQTMDVHFPYEPPPPFRGLFEKPPPYVAPEELQRLKDSISPEMGKALQFLGSVSPDKYDSAVAYTDHELGKFVDALDRLGLGDRTVVVITADHGEPLLQRGEFMHGKSLYEELVRVPLLVLMPGAAPARRDEIVSLIDLAPTLADVAHIPVPAQFLGKSLVQPREDPPAALGELTKYFTNTPVAWYVREGEWKLIAEPKRTLLFHLPSDPGEAHDIGRERPVVRGYLKSAMTSRFPTRAEQSATVNLDAGLSDESRKELRDALKALGYIDSAP